MIRKFDFLFKLIVAIVGLASLSPTIAVAQVSGVTADTSKFALKSDMTAQYIAGFTPTSPGTLTNLYTNAPCSIDRVNSYAVVVDLYGSLTESLRCTYFGAWGYGWRATIPFYAATTTTTGGTITISCNTTAPSLRISGVGSGLTSALTVVFSTTNCTPGQRQELQMDLTLGIYNATANGLIGTTTTKTLGATGSSLFVFDTAGWRAY